MAGFDLGGLVEQIKDWVLGLSQTIKILIIAGLGGVVLLILVLVFVGAGARESRVQEPATELAPGDSQGNQELLEPIDRSFEGLQIPNVPRTLSEGYLSQPFLPEPRWGIQELARFVPDYMDLLSSALRRENEKNLQILLESTD